jgi:hypothetical protein
VAVDARTAKGMNDDPGAPGFEPSNAVVEINPLLDDAQRMRLAAELFAADRDEHARAVLHSLSNDPKRESVRYQKVAATNEATGYRSRVHYGRALGFNVSAACGWRRSYCGQRLVMAHLMELLSLRAPDLLPFSPGHRFKESFTHPAVVRCQPAVDHLESGARSGRWLDRENMVAACASCNELKNDGLAPPLLPRVADDWDGGAGVFPALAEGQPLRFASVARDLRRGLNDLTVRTHVARPARD